MKQDREEKWHTNTVTEMSLEFFKEIHREVD
jgi:hypothetical protein